MYFVIDYVDIEVLILYILYRSFDIVYIFFLVKINMSLNKESYMVIVMIL